MNRRVETSITINASPETVWKILTDLPRYRDWNPFIRHAEGRIALNEELLCEPLMPGNKRTLSFRPNIVRCTPNIEFAWVGGIVIHSHIAGGEHIFRIRKMSDHKVKLIHDQIFLGVTGPLVHLIAGEKTRQGFILMNEALKAQAEAQQTDVTLRHAQTA